MPRWLRWLLVGLAGVVVLLVLLLALLPTFIDVNRYRDQVVARVEAALGRPITLDRLSLSFLPAPTLGLEGLVVGEKGAPEQGPIPPGERFVALDRLGLKLRLLPLLSRRVEVTRLVLERPQIVVERDAHGNLSIADLLGGASGPTPPPAGPQGRGPSPLAALLVERIEVRGGSLTFRDRAVVPGREVTTTVADLSARLDDVSLDRPIEADVRATFLSRTPQNVVLTGKLGPVGPAVDLRSAPADLALKATDLDLEQVAAYAGARAGASRPASPAAPSREAPPRGGPAGSAVAPAGPTLAGTGSLAATVKGPLGAPAVDATIDLTPAAITYGEAFAKKAGVPLVLAVKGAVQAGSAQPVIQLDPLTLTLHTLTLTAKGRVADPASPVVDLTVTSNEARLAGWEAVVPALAGTTLGGRLSLEAAVRGRLAAPATPASPGGPGAGPAALDLSGTVRVAGLEVRHPALARPLTDGEGVLRLTGRRASLDAFRAKLGASPLSLTAELPDLSRRYIRFALESPKLDLDPLIAAAAATSGGGDATAGGGPAADPRAAASPGRPAAAPAKPESARPARRGPAAPAKRTQTPAAPAAGAATDVGQAVAGLAADGSVRVAEGTLKGVRFSDLRGELKLRDRVFTLEQLSFGLYGGRFSGSGRADLRGKVPAIAFTPKVEQVKVNDLLSEATSLKGVVFGLLSANLAVEGKGLDASSLLASLTGEGKFALTDGRIASFDLIDRLQALVALARGGTAPADAGDRTGAKGTPVKSLSSSVRIEQGKFVTPDLSLSTGDFQLAGSGTIGFDQSVAYGLRATLPAGLARQLLGRDVARVLATDSSGAVEIPFTVGGTLSAPAFGLSGRVLQDRLRQRLEEAVGEKLQQGLEQMLRGGRRGSGQGQGGAAPPADKGGSSLPGGQPAEGGAAAGAGGEAGPRPGSPKQLLKDLLGR